MCAQFLLQSQQVIFQMILKGSRVCMATLAFGGALVGQQEVIPRNQIFIHFFRNLTKVLKPSQVSGAKAPRRDQKTAEGAGQLIFAFQPSEGEGGSEARNIPCRVSLLVASTAKASALEERILNPRRTFGRSAKRVETTIRKPILLFLLLGLFLLRYAQRAFLELLLNAPPRSLRVYPSHVGA